MSVYRSYKIRSAREIREMLMAELAESGFEAFTEMDEGFEAFVKEEDFNKTEFDAVIKKYGLNETDLSDEKIIEPINWNAQWESDYEPIVVNDRILIRAPFHKPAKYYTYEITIKPQNSFGTGHHETTQLMMELMEGDMAGFKVLDFGMSPSINSIINWVVS